MPGVVVANLGGGSIGTQMHLNGEGFVFIAALFYAISSIYLKKYSQQDDPVMLSGYQFLVGGLILSVLGFATGGRLSGFTLQSSLLLLYLGFYIRHGLCALGYSSEIQSGVPRSDLRLHQSGNRGYSYQRCFLEKVARHFPQKICWALLLVCTGIIVVNLWKKKAGEQKVPQAE